MKDAKQFVAAVVRTLDAYNECAKVAAEGGLTVEEFRMLLLGQLIGLFASLDEMQELAQGGNCIADGLDIVRRKLDEAGILSVRMQ